MEASFEIDSEKLKAILNPRHILSQNVFFSGYMENAGRHCVLIAGHGFYGIQFAGPGRKAIQAFFKKRNNQQSQSDYSRCHSYSCPSEQLNYKFVDFKFGWGRSCTNGKCPGINAWI